jgi:hypothetical protein
MYETGRFDVVMVVIVKVHALILSLRYAVSTVVSSGNFDVNSFVIWNSSIIHYHATSNDHSQMYLYNITCAHVVLHAHFVSHIACLYPIGPRSQNSMVTLFIPHSVSVIHPYPTSNDHCFT